MWCCRCLRRWRRRDARWGGRRRSGCRRRCRCCRRIWRRGRRCGISCAEILTGFHAGDALRAMHALGVLELLIPEFHGIDALVIRDAYHRYTVDEHTFVLIDTLHGLEDAQKGAMGGVGGAVWRRVAGAAASGAAVPGGAAA